MSTYIETALFTKIKISCFDAQISREAFVEKHLNLVLLISFV